MNFSGPLSIFIFIGILTVARGDDPKTFGIALRVPPLPGQIVRSLPAQIVQPLPGQITPPLSGQIVRALPGQVRRLPVGDFVRPLPGQLISPQLRWAPLRSPAFNLASARAKVAAQ